MSRTTQKVHSVFSNRQVRGRWVRILAVLMILSILAGVTPIAAAPLMPKSVFWPAQSGQGDTLSQAEIDQLARSVVLIRTENSLGSGAIISPQGLILTAAHVVEGAEQVVVGLLNHPNDPPEWRYLGDVVRTGNVDAALIELRRHADGRPLRGSPNLPYIPTRVATAQRGDSVYVFGYPAFGNRNLWWSQGYIVWVESGYFNGQQVPMYYMSNAVAAPGDSGGPVVNGNGELVGILIFGQADSTGELMSGILSAHVALMDLGYRLTQQAPKQSPPSCGSAPPPRMVVNHYGRVTFTTGQPVRLRTGPGTGSQVIALLPEGTQFIVIDGPRCVGSYWWWRVQVRPGVLPRTLSSGWVAEGVVGNYFIEPVR